MNIAFEILTFLIWVSANFLGLVVAASLIWQSSQDIKLLRSLFTKDDKKIIVAQGNRRRYLIKAAIFVLFLFVGYFSWVNAGPYFTRTALAAGSTLLVINLLLDHIDYNKL